MGMLMSGPRKNESRALRGGFEEKGMALMGSPGGSLPRAENWSSMLPVHVRGRLCDGCGGKLGKGPEPNRGDWPMFPGPDVAVAAAAAAAAADTAPVVSGPAAPNVKDCCGVGCVPGALGQKVDRPEGDVGGSKLIIPSAPVREVGFDVDAVLVMDMCRWSGVARLESDPSELDFRLAGVPSGPVGLPNGGGLAMYMEERKLGSIGSGGGCELLESGNVWVAISGLPTKGPALPLAVAAWSCVEVAPPSRAEAEESNAPDSAQVGRIPHMPLSGKEEDKAGRKMLAGSCALVGLDKPAEEASQEPWSGHEGMRKGWLLARELNAFMLAGSALGSGWEGKVGSE